MPIEKLGPYLGTTCHVRLRCHACGRRHHFFGKLRAGRYCGEVALQGHTYSTEDIEAAWSAEPPDGRRRVGAIRRVGWRALLTTEANGRA